MNSHDVMRRVLDEMQAKVRMHGMPNYLVNEIYDWEQRLREAWSPQQETPAAWIVSDGTWRRAYTSEEAADLIVQGAAKAGCRPLTKTPLYPCAEVAQLAEQPPCKR